MYLYDIKHFKLVLSKNCYSRLESDSNLCDISVSNLIERIILTYCEFSQQIYSGIENTNKILDLFIRNTDVPFIKTISKVLSRTNSSNSPKRRSMLPRKREYTWTITNNARYELEQDQLSDSEGGSFISELLEEYSYMDYGVREKIMYRDTVRMIEKSIRDNYAIVTGKGHIFYPFRIIAEPDTRYNYIVGLSEDGINVTSHRLSNIGEIKISRKNKCEADWLFVDNNIADRCIAYLRAPDEEIEVNLSAYGETIYQKLVHNRPKCIFRSKETTGGYRLYKFLCTQYQAKVFFTAFGADAVILSPQSLAAEMKEFYRTACNNY